MKTSQTPKRDTRAILVSVLAAMVFWLMNALNKDGYNMRIDYPLNVKFDDSLYVATLPLPQKVMVNITGNGWDLLQKQVSMTVPPVMYPITKPLRTRFISTTSLANKLSEHIKNIKPSDIVADTLYLEFERKITRKVTLLVDSVNIPLKSRFVVSTLINVSPREVTFEGPESLLKNMADIILVKVPGQNIGENFDEKILIDYPRSPLIKASADKVLVGFEVEYWQGAFPPEKGKK